MLSLEASSRIHFQNIQVDICAVLRVRWLKTALQLGSLWEFVAARNEALTMINAGPVIILDRRMSGGFFELANEGTETQVFARFRLFT